MVLELDMLVPQTLKIKTSALTWYAHPKSGLLNTDADVMCHVGVTSVSELNIMYQLSPQTWYVVSFLSSNSH